MISESIPTTMRALILEGAGWENLHIKTLPVPIPNENQLLAKVDCAGVCTSLLKIIQQGPNHPLMYGRDLKNNPVILGDEGSITLVKVGAQLKKDYQIGERYVIQPAVYSSPIYEIETYSNMGQGIYKLGSGYTLPGQLAEYILITEEEIAAKCLIKVPREDIPYSHAALTETLSCCVSAQERHVHHITDDLIERRKIIRGLLPKGVLVIVGAGMMGRMNLDVAMSQPVRSVIVSEPIDSRLKMVSLLFAERAKKRGINFKLVNPKAENLLEVVLSETEGRGADDVIVAVGNKVAIETSQQLLGPGGTLNIFGGLPKKDSHVTLDSYSIHYLETTVVGSSGGIPWDMKYVMDLIANEDMNPALHITNVADLNHVPELLRLMSENKLAGKAIVYPHYRTTEIHYVQNWTREKERDYLNNRK